jgi:hypothetical protein
MNDRQEKGPIRILCDEIGFRFDPRLESPRVLVAFVRELVSTVAQIRHIQQVTTFATSKPPSEGSERVLVACIAMLSSGTTESMVTEAAIIHDLCHELNPDEAYPADHLIDMLSGCASAIRFGLETPCHSRHAAEAARHIWGQYYGICVHDQFSGAWSKDWARAQMQEAITALAIEATGWKDGGVMTGVVVTRPPPEPECSQ